METNNITTDGRWRVYAKDWIYCGKTCVATIQDTGNADEKKGNADRIVECVNMHNELLAQKTELRKALEEVSEFLKVLPMLRLANKQGFDECINIEGVTKLYNTANYALEMTK